MRVRNTTTLPFTILGGTQIAPDAEAAVPAELVPQALLDSGALVAVTDPPLGVGAAAEQPPDPDPEPGVEAEGPRRTRRTRSSEE